MGKPITLILDSEQDQVGSAVHFTRLHHLDKDGGWGQECFGFGLRGPDESSSKSANKWHGFDWQVLPFKEYRWASASDVILTFCRGWMAVSHSFVLAGTLPNC